MLGCRSAPRPTHARGLLADALQASGPLSCCASCRRLESRPRALVSSHPLEGQVHRVPAWLHAVGSSVRRPEQFATHACYKADLGRVAPRVAAPVPNWRRVKPAAQCADVVFHTVHKSSQEKRWASRGVAWYRQYLFEV